MENAAIYRDRELFALIANGDEMAFEELFHSYVPRLRKVMFKLIRSDAAVEDIIQEVFFYLWTDRERLAKIDVPENWIFRIAYNRSYSYLAKQAQRSKIPARLLEQIHEKGENQPELALAFHETSRLIQEAVHLLPEQAKRIFRLSREAGLKAAEISKQLDISVQTVRNSLVRSSKAIKDYLASNDVILPSAILFCTLKIFFTR